MIFAEWLLAGPATVCTSQAFYPSVYFYKEVLYEKIMTTL